MHFKWSKLVFIASALLILCFIPYIYSTHQRLRVSFLDVGQGDAALIRTPSGQNILIDAGDTDGGVLDSLGKELGFWNRYIDLFILTHPHRDHFGGFLDLVDRIPIKKVAMTGAVSDDPLYPEFLKAVEEHHYPVDILSADKDYEFSPGVVLDNLFPFEPGMLYGKRVKDANAVSHVAVLKKDGIPLVLFTGDADMALESEILLRGFDVRAGILKVGHHGSKYSTSDSFLQAVHPKEAVISVGKENDFGHPHAETLEKLRGILLHLTSQEGTVRYNF